MKAITLLKILTFGMAVIIIAGVAFVGYKLSDLDIKSKPSPIIQTNVPLVFPENINAIEPCGDKLCLMTIGHKQGRRLMIVDPKTGRLSAILTFNDRP